MLSYFLYSMTSNTTKRKMKYTPIPIKVSLLFRYLHQELGLGISLQRLRELYPQYAKIFPTDDCVATTRIFSVLT